MSLIRAVTALVAELGTASGEDLIAHLPGFTKDQIFQALQNAKWRGKLKIVEPSRGRGPCGGRTAAKYATATPGEPKPIKAVKVKPPAIRPVCSVWDMGERYRETTA